MWLYTGSHSETCVSIFRLASLYEFVKLKLRATTKIIRSFFTEDFNFFQM